MRFWQDLQQTGSMPSPAGYGATTPHQFWPGGMWYWTGMVVPGFEGAKDYFQGAKSRLSEKESVEARARMVALGLRHKEVADTLSLKLPTFRSKLYGRLGFTEKEICSLRGMLKEDNYAASTVGM